ncbi:MAG: 5-methyltetrahydropteroyltriglutamate--homocysteine S-methyltransferase [SAR324 cluster bacterium]|nr:5-methyltetrahydropteroyltriglutamate--homocysteine S-methyltransferase [SAR324 cluster bacterium]
MSRKNGLPFRADHVGSLLRPQYLLEAREKRSQQKISAEELRKIEDQSIREAVRIQEDIGLRGITDGEHRRTFFHIDFLEHLEGVSIEGGISVQFHSAKGNVNFAPPRLKIVSKLRHTHDIQRKDFEFLKSVTGQVPKVCIPSPTMAHFRGGREAIDKHTYPDLELFFEDLAQCYRDELSSLASAGCTYVQLDDTNLAYLCDPALRQGAVDRGDDPNELPRIYARLINAAIKERPDTMTIAIHLCRGNFKSAWVAEGGYEPVAEIMFNELDVDAFFLEYDDERSGDFAPLRFVPKDKTIVLGLITTKSSDLESKDDLKKRVEEAAQYVPLEQLCLSPQCGFSSTVDGNQISFDEQAAKLRLTAETALDIWGEL